MSVAVVTGSAGLIGSQCVRRLAAAGHIVVGIDNDMRREFFGEDASTSAGQASLVAELGDRYQHHDVDIRDDEAMDAIFAEFGTDIEVVIHAAAQPGHAKWTMRNPIEDFDINARATLMLLERVRRECPDAAFVFLSTSKVYGDRPNRLPLIEAETRLELPVEHEFFNGITESMSIDQSLHTSMGMSKVAADVMVQEYARAHEMNCVVVRNCVVAGSAQSASKSHGMLGYIAKCVAEGLPYTAFGNGGKQVRDILHVEDLAVAIELIANTPVPGAVYNLGGGRASSCSLLEAIRIAEDVFGNKMNLSFGEGGRAGDHRWYIGSNEAFLGDYPAWSPSFDITKMVAEIQQVNYS